MSLVKRGRKKGVIPGARQKRLMSIDEDIPEDAAGSSGMPSMETKNPEEKKKKKRGRKPAKKEEEKVAAVAMVAEDAETSSDDDSLDAALEQLVSSSPHDPSSSLDDSLLASSFWEVDPNVAVEAAPFMCPRCGGKKLVKGSLLKAAQAAKKSVDAAFKTLEAAQLALDIVNLELEQNMVD